MGFAYFAHGSDGVTMLGVAVATSEAGRAPFAGFAPEDSLGGHAVFCWRSSSQIGNVLSDLPRPRGEDLETHCIPRFDHVFVVSWVRKGLVEGSTESIAHARSANRIRKSAVGASSASSSER